MRHKINNLKDALKAIELIACHQCTQKQSPWDDVYMIAHSWVSCDGHESWKELQYKIIKELDK